MSESSKDNFDKQPESRESLYLPKIEPFVGPDGRVVFIDQFMMTAKGRQKMNGFVSTVDSSPDIVRLVQSLSSDEAPSDNQNVLRLILSRQGQLGFTRAELTSAYVDNPAMNKTLRLRQIAHQDGAVDLDQMYFDILRLLGNLSRYEMLHGVHNPGGDIWRDRAERVLPYRGRQFVQHLPTRFNHPEN